MVRIPGGYVVLSTGTRVPRATSTNGLRFTGAGTALLRKPTWAKPGEMWAADLASYGGRWLLFFSAYVRGIKSSSHCIGVATSTSATGTFTPLDERPLICPPGNAVPAAEDQYVDISLPDPPAPSATADPTADPTATPTADPTTTPTPSATASPTVQAAPNPANSHGAIDPSFTVIDGRPYLLYKTDGKPSSLRVLPLTPDGRHAAAKSWQLLRSGGVVENPAMIKRGRYWYLFTSEGDYSRCSYRTVWRRATSPLASWQRAMPHVLLSNSQQRLCGPGGADVVLNGKRTLLYFHSWTCGGTRRACGAPLHAYAGHDAARRPVRALYGLRLAFTKRGFPRIDRWLTVNGLKKTAGS